VGEGTVFVIRDRKSILINILKGGWGEYYENNFLF